MSKTRIEWADVSWNPVTGCSKISEGCRNCYALRMAPRLSGRCGYPVDDPCRVTLHPDRLDLPFHWRKPQRVFVNSMSDLFHRDVPDAFIAEVFARMWWAPEHTFMILIKRPERMPELMPWIEADLRQRELDLSEIGEPTPLTWPLPNVWIGVSAENQETADERIPALLRTPATVRFVSCEPLLGPVALDDICISGTREGTGSFVNALSLEDWTEEEARAEMGQDYLPTLDWVIAGGESGPGARPMHPDWARGLRDQCEAAGVPFFFKQWGEWFPRDQWEHNPELVLPDDSRACIESPRTHVFADVDGPSPVHRVGKRAAGRLLDGREHLAFPEVPRA